MNSPVNEEVQALTSILHELSLDVGGGFLHAGARGVLGVGRSVARLSCRVGAGFHGSGGIRVLVGMG